MSHNKIIKDNCYTYMTEKEILDQAILAEKEIKEGEITSHDQVYEDFKKW